MRLQFKRLAQTAPAWLVFLAALCLPGSAVPAPPAAATLRTDIWEALPVLDGGRFKPFATMARDLSLRLSGLSRPFDSRTGRSLSPTAWYLQMLLDWSGWSARRERPVLSGRPDDAYFSVHQPDHWDKSLVLRVDWPPLRAALGLPPGQSAVAPAVLRNAEVRLPTDGKKRAFVPWALALTQKGQEQLSVFETNALDLLSKYVLYIDHRSGRGFFLLPSVDGESSRWVSLNDLCRSDWDDKTDPKGTYRRARDLFLNLQKAYSDGDWTRFEQLSREFVGLVRAEGPALGTYPDVWKIDLELSYDRWKPFRVALWLAAAACLLLSVATGKARAALGGLGAVAYGAACFVLLIGGAVRAVIAGRAPVTNMYESMLYVAFCSLVLGVLVYWRWRRGLVLAVASAVATVLLLLAEAFPAVLDPSIQPLQPVLRSNFWLTSHVLSVTFSYAAFALATGLSDVALGVRLFARTAQLDDHSLTETLERCLQAGVVLLAIGIVLGAVWADYAWGRFWGWDPKEVWSLITLLGYLALLHARHVGWVSDRGLQALTVVCFSLVVMAWYGVNFALGAGLHSYGFGSGGQGYVGAALAMQLAFVAVASLKRDGRSPSDSSGAALNHG